MKLVKNNKYQKYISSCLGLIVALGLVGCNKEDINIIDPMSSTTEINYEDNQIVFTIPTEEEIQNIISELNIVEDSGPSNIYKVLQFGDNEGYHRVMIVSSEVNFVVDSEGNLIGETYRVSDVFSKGVLFETTDFKTIDVVHNKLFENGLIISYEEISSLRDIADFYGASDSYISGIMPNIDNKQFLSNSYVAKLYASLVPTNIIVLYDDLLQDKTLSIG